MITAFHVSRMMPYKEEEVGTLLPALRKFCCWGRLMPRHRFAVSKKTRYIIFSFILFLFPECICCSFRNVAFMTDRAYADWWQCIIIVKKR